MTTDDGYADWLRANPPPDLQEVVSKHGGYDKITPEAWAEYDRAMAEWQEARRHRHVVAAQGAAVADDREALCICGLPGIYSRPRKGGGRAIWRCEEHRDLWPSYAAELSQKPPEAACDDKDADRIDRYVQRPQYDEPYDAAADFAGSLDEAYAAVRDRVAAGGEGWKPK